MALRVVEEPDEYRVPPMTVGTRMRLAREFSNCTVLEAAEGMSISHATYRALEKGFRSPRIDQLEAFSRYLKIPLTWLLTGVESDNPRLLPLLDELRQSLDPPTSADSETAEISPSGSLSVGVTVQPRDLRKTTAG